jgi:hypothetical protein
MPISTYLWCRNGWLLGAAVEIMLMATAVLNAHSLQSLIN